MTSPKPTRSVVPAKGATLPKAKVLYADQMLTTCETVPGMARFNESSGTFTSMDICGAFIPTATQKQARALVQWANLTREQKVEAIARILTDRRGGSMITSHTRRDAVAITDVIEGPAP